MNMQINDTPKKVAVRVKPGAGRSAVGGSYEGPFGTALVIAVREKAVDGAATEAVRRALAAALGVPASTVALRAGGTGRDKLFAVSRPPGGLDDRLEELRA
jgi:uncharacterized protein YggU (UPF0235/DUF167 family)